MVLRPREHESPLWASAFEFDIEANAVHFVAVWVDVDISVGSGKKVLSTSMVTTGRGSSFRLIPIPLPDLYPPSSIDANGVRVEVVSEEDAKRALVGARYRMPVTEAR